MTIYLDNMAATPVDPRVAERHREAMVANLGNAHSSEHAFGVDAEQAIAEAGEALVRAVGSPADQVTFTPGASTALWLAVEDAIARAFPRKARIAATAVEHPALLSALRRAEEGGRIDIFLIGVDEIGSPRLDELEMILSAGADLLCAMAANNEVGTITDVASITALAERYGSRSLVDASQAAGRIDMSVGSAPDLLVVSGAKIYGPRRAGALIGNLGSHAVRLNHDILGSPDVSSAIALAFAMNLRAEEGARDESRLAGMRDALQSYLLDTVPGLRVNGALGARLAGSLHVSTPHVPGEAVVGRLWGRVAVSTGAACQSGVPGPSHVLEAMHIPDWAKDGAIRVGIGRFNTEEEIVLAGELIASALSGSDMTRRFA